MSLLGLRYHPGGAILPGADVCPRTRADELARTSDPTLTFNPAEWRVPDLAFRLPEPDSARCEELDRWAQQNEQVDLPRELALAAAARLRTMPWSDARTVTETFFVFAVDFDLQQLEQDVLPHAPSHLTD